MKYDVVKTYAVTQVCTVEAESELEAIEIAKDLDEEEWENNPNQYPSDYVDYIAHRSED